MQKGKCRATFTKCLTFLPFYLIIKIADYRLNLLGIHPYLIREQDMEKEAAEE